jgi:hypothetical protein
MAKQVTVTIDTNLTDKQLDVLLALERYGSTGQWRGTYDERTVQSLIKLDLLDTADNQGTPMVLITKAGKLALAYSGRGNKGAVRTAALCAGRRIQEHLTKAYQAVMLADPESTPIERSGNVAAIHGREDGVLNILRWDNPFEAGIELQARVRRLIDAANSRNSSTMRGVNLGTYYREAADLCSSFLTALQQAWMDNRPEPLNAILPEAPAAQQSEVRS